MKSTFCKYFFYKALLLLTLLFVREKLHAQIENTSLFRYKENLLSDSLQNQEGLSFNFYGNGYLKNNEYFNKITKGYTLFGYQAAPSFTYHLSSSVRINAGVYIRKDFGNSRLEEVQPVFTFEYTKNGFQFLFGTIEGSVEHNLLEPMYDFENVIQRRFEQGFQLKYENEKLNLDGWLDWQKMIYNQSPFQERFWAGLKVQYEPKKHLYIHFSGIALHQGGQINNSDKPVQTFANLSGGLKYQKDFFKSIFLKSFSMSIHGLFFNKTGDGTVPFNNGKGVYANVYAKSKWISLLISYWNGHTFYSPMGGSLFQSVSDFTHQNQNAENERSLLFVRLAKTWKLLPQCFIELRIEPYYDLMNQKMEHSEGLYITYNLNKRTASYK